MIATLTWDKQQVRVPFCCWASLIEEKEDYNDSSDSSDDDDQDDNDQDDNDDEDDNDNDAETYLTSRQLLFAAFATDVAVFPGQFRVAHDMYPRAYIDYLQICERQKRQLRIMAMYDAMGPQRRCRCGFFLQTSTDQCFQCKEDDKLAAILEILPLDDEFETEPPEQASLSEKEKNQLDAFLKDNDDMFAHSPGQLGRTTFTEHRIDTGDATPIYQNYFQTFRTEREFIEAEIL